MSTQGLEVIDQTVHTTHSWINELAARVDYGSKRSVLRLLRTTLQLLRDRIQPDELAQFSAQLPLLLRGIMFEGWHPKRVLKERPDFDDALCAGMGQDIEFRGAEDARYVFDLLNNRISSGEVDDIRACLPSDMREYWSEP